MARLELNPNPNNPTPDRCPLKSDEYFEDFQEFTLRVQELLDTNHRRTVAEWERDGSVSFLVSAVFQENDGMGDGVAVTLQG